MAASNEARVGVVVIGRNEGRRLVRCLESVGSAGALVVYVDSGSEDDSVENARKLGVDVVELTADKPFTAARGRNTGVERLLGLDPQIAFVQFVDGDCELLADWLVTAEDFLAQHSDVAVVCGRLRERHPERSIYNQLCDLEWAGPSGEIEACGGIAMMRVAALLAAGSFRTDMIAGEEPELCLRLRQQGWKIWRVATEMALHDAEMLRFGQWWTRMVRTGFAFSQAVDMHPDAAKTNGRRSVFSALVWGFGLPLLAIISALLGYLPIAIVALLAYPLQVMRLARRGDLRPGLRWMNAFFLVLGKFPEAIGTAKYLMSRRASKPARIIEYK